MILYIFVKLLTPTFMKTLLIILIVLVVALSAALVYISVKYKEIKLNYKCAVADLIGNVAELKSLEEKLEQLVVTPEKRSTC